MLLVMFGLAAFESFLYTIHSDVYVPEEETYELVVHSSKKNFKYIFAPLRILQATSVHVARA
jgi:hypothetical protein